MTDLAAPRGWLPESNAVLRKDVAVEFRTRYALNAVVLFAVTTLVAVSFAVQSQGASGVQAALLWIVLLFAALTGLMRTFVAEEDGRTADLLRLAASGTAVYLGKLAFNLGLLLALTVILVPGFAIFMGMAPKDWGQLAAMLAAGVWGLAAVLTFVSALVARARTRGSLGAVVAFPLIWPLLHTAIRGTEQALLGDPGGWLMLRGLVAYAGIMTVVSLLLFDHVWSD